MRKRPIGSMLPAFIGSVLILLFLFAISPQSANVVQGAEPIPANVARVTKTIDQSSIQAGDIVTFRIRLLLGQERRNLTIDDIFAGGGRAPDTDLVGPVILCGINPVVPCQQIAADLVTNQLNRVVYRFTLPSPLSAGEYELFYDWRINRNLSNLANMSNEVHLDQVGVTGHLSTSTVPFSGRGCETITATKTVLSLATRTTTTRATVFLSTKETTTATAPATVTVQGVSTSIAPSFTSTKPETTTQCINTRTTVVTRNTTTTVTKTVFTTVTR